MASEAADLGAGEMFEDHLSGMNEIRGPHTEVRVFYTLGQRCLELMRPVIVAGLVVASSFGIERNTAEAQTDNVDTVQEEPPLQPGETRNVTLPEDSIAIGNFTSVGMDYSPGWAEIFAGNYQGTSTTNVKGRGHVSANTFFIDTGATGEVSFMSGVAAQHQVIDLSIVLPKTPDMQILPSPQRVKDTRLEGRYMAGEVVSVPLGREHAGKGAIINLTVDRAMAPSWYAAYPCNVGYQGTSTVNPNGIGATPATDIVKVDSDGNICIIGSHSTVEGGGLIVDLKGFTNWAIEAPRRVLDTRLTGQRLAGGSEYVYETGKPHALFVGRLTVDRVYSPSWFAAYPTSSGWPGNSLVNPDGFSATSGLLVVKTDEQGRFSIKGSVDGDIIIDQSGIVPLADLGLNPEDIGGPRRIYDSRLEQPLEIPDQYSCDKVAWLEKHIINDQQVYKYAVYDAVTNTVNRYDADTTPIMPYDFEINPARCNDDAIVFTSYNPSINRNGIRQRDLSTGTEQWIPTLYGGAESALEPDPLADGKMLFTNWAHNQQIVQDTKTFNSYASNVNEFSISDTGAIFANIQVYNSPAHLGPVDDYVKVEVRRKHPQTNQQETFEHEFTLSTGQRVKNIQVSSDGEKVYILKSDNAGDSYRLFELRKHPTATSPFTGLPLIDYVPVALPQGINATNMQSYRAIGQNMVVAIVGQTNPRPVLINLATQTAVDLSLANDTFMSASL